jgi:hypothetical protein
MQTWNTLPTWTKFVLVAMLAALLVVGVANPKIFDLITSNSDRVKKLEIVEVKFNIYSKDTNDPLEKVEVQFIFDGAPAPRVTNTDGYVRIEIPKRDDVDVVIKKKGFHDLNRTINLKADPNRTITYFLERNKSHSSYKLNGNSFSNGMIIKKVSSKKLKYSVSMGDSHDSSVDKPSMIFIADNLSNQESKYEINNSNKENIFEMFEKVGVSTNSISAKMIISMSQNHKNYPYNSTLSEDEIFANSSILYKYSNGEWKRSIIGKQPTNAQILELSEHWDLSNLFLEYPSSALKLGESWSINHLLWSSDGGFLDPSIRATLKEITEYEGQPAALILLEGKISYSAADQSVNDSDDISLQNKVLKSLLRQFYSDYAEEYILSKIKETVATDLFDNKFSLNDDLMKEKSPDLYNAIFRIYQEVIADPELSSYSLSTIKGLVNDKMDKYSVLSLLIKKIENGSNSTIKNDVRDTLKIESIISGKIFRSLEKPIDLYQEIKLVGEAVQGSGSSSTKLDLESVYRFSVKNG